MSNEISMSIPSQKVPVLATGAMDLSDGVVFKDSETVERWANVGAHEDKVEHKTAKCGDKRYLSVAPGAGDISEGVTFVHD
ncbi:MAG: hypothetical protein EOL88_07890 [Bacteroidia bacterium]|nr:hypothetical protein [Bacteroidia bacterium]